ncbi:hypothetical protein DSO57_1037415 [Entomophthora muscae]|uniref:Uncharacterized protein n=2 Tax=Entomophthora muscae TaxID=34485 RepID=A0ACC2UJS8_9FUNG|nr:hypothetical protein DSO57_1036867 [Entomophthora muscae]KAJ9087021.1 hypothetical protein DSO57_1037415 [Entomophthora muscae]
MASTFCGSFPNKGELLPFFILFIRFDCAQNIVLNHSGVRNIPDINTIYIGISKFFGKNKENIINWLNHSAAKLCTSRIPHEKWVQEASKRLYKAAANWFFTWVGSQTVDQLDNWEEFKADITHNFRVTESLQDIAIQHSNLSQKTTITGYANEVEEIRRKSQNPAQADNVHTRASFINRMKPSVASLIHPEANTSMPALIAEAKYAEKRTNMEYAAHNGNGRENSNGNKRQNTNNSNSNSNHNNGNCSQRAKRSCPKKEDTAKVNNAEIATRYESDPTFSDL